MRFSIFSLLTLMTITVMCLVALNFLGCFKTADDLTTIEINQILSSYNEAQSDKHQQIVEDLVLFLEDKHGIKVKVDPVDKKRKLIRPFVIENVALRNSVKLALQPISLSFFVKNGQLVMCDIDNPEFEKHVELSTKVRCLEAKTNLPSNLEITN